MRGKAGIRYILQTSQRRMHHIGARDPMKTTNNCKNFKPEFK